MADIDKARLYFESAKTYIDRALAELGGPTGLDSGAALEQGIDARGQIEEALAALEPEAPGG